MAFVPTENFHGSISDLITFKAWDRTSHTGTIANGDDSVSTIQTSSTLGEFTTGGMPWKVSLSSNGHTAFVAERYGGLRIYDISNPAESSFIGSFSTSSATNVTLSADEATAYLTDSNMSTGTSSLKIIDISDPTNPQLIKNYDTEDWLWDTTLSNDGNTAFLANYQEGLKLLDISDPTEPIVLNSLRHRWLYIRKSNFPQMKASPS